MINKIKKNYIDHSLTLRGIYRYFSFSRRFQYYDLNQINDFQYLKLKQLLLAAEGTEYYKDLFKKIKFNPREDFKTIQDIKHIPVLTKDIARENRKRLINDKFSKKHIKLRTSGSTGHPFEINVSYEAWIVEQAVIWRHWKWAEYKFREKMGILRSYSPKNKDKKYKTEILRNFTFFSPFHLDKKNMSEYLKVINANKIRILRGYPSSLLIFAKFIKEHNQKINPIKFILTASEVLTKNNRDYIESAFDTKIFDHYGLADISVMMGECEMHNGLHNYEDYGYLELHGEKEEKSIIGTNLHNHAMPLIRYDTGDLAELNNDSCECGRQFPLVKSILGRKSQHIITSGGRNIPLTNFFTMFDKYLDILKWQLIQASYKLLIVNIRVSKLSNNKLLKLKSDLNKRIPKDISFEIVINERFFKTSEGKEPPFYSKLVK